MPQPGGVFLFLGPDRARKLQRIQAVERGLGILPFDRHQIDGATVSAPELVALCRQRPAASVCRLIVVDQAHRLGAGAVEGLVGAAPLIAATSRVILLVEPELTPRHPLARAGAALTAELFPGRDVAAVKPFALTDAMGRGDLVAALHAVRDQLSAGRDPIELLGLAAWQAQRWLIIKRLALAGYTADRMAAATGLKPWQVQRLQADVAHRSLDSLHEGLAHCWEADLGCRSGRMLPVLAVERLVVELTTAGCEAARAA